MISRLMTIESNTSLKQAIAFNYFRTCTYVLSALVLFEFLCKLC